MAHKQLIAFAVAFGVVASVEASEPKAPAQPPKRQYARTPGYEQRRPAPSKLATPQPTAPQQEEPKKS